MGNMGNRLKRVNRAIKSGAFKVKNATVNSVRKMKEMIANLLSKLPQPPIKSPFSNKINGKNGQSKETNASNNGNQKKNDAPKGKQERTQNKPSNSNQAGQHNNKQDNDEQGNQNNNNQSINNKNNDKRNSDVGKNNNKNENVQNTSKQTNDSQLDSDSQQDSSLFDNGSHQNYSKQLDNDKQLDSTNRQDVCNQLENVNQQDSSSQLGGNGQQPNQITQDEFDKMKEALHNAKRKCEQQEQNEREVANSNNQQGLINKNQNDGGQDVKEGKQTAEQSVQIAKQGSQTTEQGGTQASAQNPQGDLQVASNVQNTDKKEESAAYKDDKDGQKGFIAAEFEDEQCDTKGVQETDVSQPNFGMAAANGKEDDAQGSNDAQSSNGTQAVSTFATDKNISKPSSEGTSLDMLDNILPNFSGNSVPFGDLNQDAEKVNDIIVKNIIQKFIKMRFKSANSQLNTRQGAMEKVSGVSKWDTMQVVKHKTTKEYNKMLKDKYDYDYDSGKQEQIPLSIYIDLSPSMDKYIPRLITIAMQLLKNGVRVIIGTNEEAKLQINEIPPNMSKFEFSELIVNYCKNSSMSKNNAIKFEILDCNIGSYLTKNKAEKTLVFSDYDPSCTICDLSRTKCHVYWFNFDGICDRYLSDFKGVICAVSNSHDILKAISLFTNRNYNALTYKQSQADLESASKNAEYNDGYYL